VSRTYLRASPVNLATDLARYGSAAVWRGVYYRGEKIGFTVSQTVPTDEGFELQEDGRLQMALLGATTPAAMRTTAHVDRAFALHDFEFSLDPGTGAIQIRGTIDPRPVGGKHRIRYSITSSAGTRSDVIELPEAPALSLNLSRVLANGGLVAGARHRWTVFDPATLTNAPMEITVGTREVVRAADANIPAFRVEMAFKGQRITSWITDTGEVVKEESPLGLITVRETQELAQRIAVPRRVQIDLLNSAAIVPTMNRRIDNPRDVRRIRFTVEGADLSSPDLQGVGQSVEGSEIEVRDPQTLKAGPHDPDAARYLAPEAFIESDAPEIRAEAEAAVAGVRGNRERAERLTRYVNGLLDKKPTISLPSAREVLRTKVGDCNEHTVLYVAMARALGIPSRIAVGLTYVHGVQGAFYYHAWPEVYLEEEDGEKSGENARRGLWLPVDPTLNEFPANGTHVRLARGGLDKQAAILPLIGRLKINVVDLEFDPNATPILIGPGQVRHMEPIPVNTPQRQSRCRCCR
jgi:transglutaminase-like putative cysteine protease